MDNSKKIKAVCKDCGKEFQSTREAAEKIFEEIGYVCCEECVGKVPIKKIVETAAAKRSKELVVGPCDAIARQYGIPAEVAELYFVQFDGKLYIKNSGLLYLASKKGYSRIEVSDSFVEKDQEWVADCRIYPRLTKEILEGVGALSNDLQKQALDFATAPTNGTGRASKANVKMITMHVFLREMAQTRAQNRALRAYTGYGCSAEEMPEAQLEECEGGKP